EYKRKICHQSPNNAPSPQTYPCIFPAASSMAYSTSSTTPYTHSAARYMPPMEFDMSTLTLFDTSFLESAKDSACSTYPPAQCPDQILARFELGLFFHDASKRRKMSSSELSHLQKLWNAVSDDGSRVPPTNGWKGKPRSSDSDATVRALPVRAPGVGARPRFRFENRQPDQRLELVYSSAPCRRGTSIPPRHRLANLQASQAAENQGHRTHAVDETVPLSFVVETDDIHAIVDAVKLAEENNIQRGGLAIRRAVIAAAEQRFIGLRLDGAAQTGWTRGSLVREARCRARQNQRPLRARHSAYP
ncbi:hypothetical protein OF83DRAFT_1151184, partial [Amylostereum chailletii]